MFKYIYDYWPHCNYLNKHFFPALTGSPGRDLSDYLYIYIQCAVTMSLEMQLQISNLPFFVQLCKMEEIVDKFCLEESL